MGLRSPLHYVKGYSFGKPPVIIFVICLILCATATVGMGLFIQYSDTISNSEVKGKWLSFLNHLGSLNYCVSVSDANKEVDPGPITQFIDGGGTLNSSNETSVTVSVSVHLVNGFRQVPGAMLAAYGDIVVGDWASILDVQHPIKSLRMTFGVPMDSTSDENACLILTVPPSFLPDSSRSDVCVPTFLNRTITHVGTLTANPLPGDSFCKAGSAVKLNIKAEDDFYLSKLEKRRIYIRLLYSSYILFAVAISLTCFSSLRVKGYTSVMQSDRVPLNL